MSRGKLILIEGIDRSGKSSQCIRLAERLTTTSSSLSSSSPTSSSSPSSKATVVRFPDRTTPIGKLINEYLSASPSSTTTDSTTTTTTTNTKLQQMHLLFSANRWELMPHITELLLQGTHVILDRYVYSGIAYSHTASREGPSSSSGHHLDFKWLEAPDLGLLKPDILIFLNVSPYDTRDRPGFGQELYEKLEFQNKVFRCFERILPKNKNHGSSSEEEEEVVFKIDGTLGMDQVSDLIFNAVQSVDEVGSQDLKRYSQIVF